MCHSVFGLKRVFGAPQTPPFKFGNAKVGKIFENKEFFVLTIVNEAEIFSFPIILTYVDLSDRLRKSINFNALSGRE